MRMLLIHSNYLKYKPTRKALKYIKDVEKKEVKLDNVLVVFTCAEGRDQKHLKEVVEKSIKEIKHQFEEVKAKNIVIYPYAHLGTKNFHCIVWAILLLNLLKKSSLEKKRKKR